MFDGRLALLCACVVLSACDQLSAGLTPTSERINTAFPLPDTLQTARNALNTSLEGNKAGQQNMSEQYAKLMTVRALTCTAKTPIGRFDTAANIKGKVTDLECFQKQDLRLAEWIGLQRLSLAMALPALVPVSPLPAKALLPNINDASGQVSVAAAANVMVVKGAQRYSVVQLPGGKSLSSFPVPEQTYRPASLSPNGRVLAVPTGSRNLRLIETETGNVLWTTEDYAELIAWLPQVNAALLTQTNTGVPHLLDIRNSTIEVYPAAEKRLTWAISMPAASGKYLVGSGQTASLMELSRAASGSLEAAPLKQWRLTGNAGGNNTPFLMNEGNKLVYPSGQDLGWLDLQSDQQGTWQLSALQANGFSKLDEQSILFDSWASGSTPAASRLLDIAQGTVSSAKNLDARDGALVSLLPRNGYLKRGNSAVTIGSAIEADTPQPLETLVSEALLARQLARVAAAAAAGASADNSYPPGMAGAPFPPSVKPLLTDIPANARVAVVGVYEAVSLTAGASGGARQAGTVRINVQPGATPLVLVLSNYEPVRWVINSNGRKIAAILTSSYGEATVMGPTTRVLKIGTKYAYKMDSREYEALKQDIARQVANPVNSFQGAYRGQEFLVN
ncbi:MAG: hypothetical protein ACT6Q9_02145 [Polaromonas sp.]|uniref:hypothetical protein n=1 Tax=Polaromonas sp. TaxID=1869339 RepID=UPI0040356E56